MATSSSAWYNTSIPRDRFIGCVGISQHPVWYEFMRERGLDAYEVSVLHQIYSKPKSWQLNIGQISNSWNVSKETVRDAILGLLKRCPELKAEKADWGLRIDAQELYDLIYDRIVSGGEDRWD